MGEGIHWVFLSIERPRTIKSDSASSAKGWLLEIQFPNIDRVETLVVYQDGVREHSLNGDDVAFEKWPIEYRKPTIPLNRLGSNSAVVYFKIKSDTPLIFPIELKTKAEQQSAQHAEYFLYGIFYGSIFILALYNAGIYFSLRDKSYRFYILYILFFLWCKPAQPVLANSTCGHPTTT